MSSTRKVLHAIRRNGPNTNKTNGPSQIGPIVANRRDINDNINDRRGEKRKKNLANDRLKRLRTALNEDVINKEPINNQSSSNSNKVTKSANERFKQLQTTLKKGVGRTVQGLRNKISKIKRHADTTANDHDVIEKKPNISTQDTVFGFSTTAVGCFNFRKTVDNYSSEEFMNSIKRFAQPSPDSPANNDDSMEWSCSDDEDNGNNCIPKASDLRLDSKLYIVVDSNILISHLDVIKTIVETQNNDPPKPVIYIPWIVLEELNYFKESCLRRKAQNANKYISDMLQKKNEHLLGQSVEEVCQQKDTGKSADDKILACCLQVKEKYNNMVFLTNDINLKLKAQVSSVPVCSIDDIIKQLRRSQKPLNKFQQILDKMTYVCATAIRKGAQEAFGDVWNDMYMLKTPPCNMEQCIKIFKVYWFTVFEELVLKQFMKAVDDLSGFLNSGNNDINQLAMLCVRICIYLKDIPNTTDVVEVAIREINQIKDSS